MATVAATFHNHISHRPAKGQIRRFVSDLFKDLTSTLKQMRGEEKSDLFRDHILAMSISYFALIVLLIGVSLPILAFLIDYSAL